MPLPSSMGSSRQARKRLLKLLILLAAVLLIILFFYFYIFKRKYHSYRVRVVSEQEDLVSTKYEEFDGQILRYATDTVSLVSTKLATKWSATYEMSNPVACIRGERAVIADRDGTSLVMLNTGGVTGTATTPYAIVKAAVSASGLAAVILDGGDGMWINLYGADGTLIAENQTTMNDPGYPMDLSISDNGVILMVGFQYIDESDTTSYVAFYNFGDVGQNEDDRIVSGYTYEGVVIPQIECLDESRAVAMRDDGFTVYSGRQIPKEKKTVTVEKEIVSTFHDGNNIGLVFKNDDTNALYTMEVYDPEGEKRFSRSFNIAYTSIKMSRGYILMFNSAQLCILDENGNERFMGTVDGTIRDISRIAYNRYVLVLDTGVSIISFK